ncbi:MAG: ATP-binding protein [Solirubrobacterales bacterium]
MSVCAVCGYQANGPFKFCSECGSAAATDTSEQRQVVTALFCDVVGSTSLGESTDPEALRALLARYFEQMKAIVERHGGTVEKFIGDAVMAVFGVPRAHGDDPDRAVAAALALVERLAAQSDRLELRIGVEAGEVLASERGGDLAVTGEPAHAAARLQQAAAPGEILVGGRAASACRNIRLGDRRQVDAAGFPQPLDAFPASATIAPTPVVAASGTRDQAPLLGRAAELEALRLAYLRSVRERRPHLALIVGEAGAGKTRLARELFDAVRALDPAPLLLAGRNPPYGDGIAFWALAELLRGAADTSRDASAEQVRDRLRMRLEELGAARAGETATILAGTLNGSDADSDAGAIRRAWRQLIAALAEERPVLIAVDDAHWADEGFLDLVEDAASLPAHPVLIVCTARPEIDDRRPDFAASDHRQRIELGPLAPEATEELAATLIGDAELDLARQIAATSGGNPFFTEEIARAVGFGGEEPGGGLPDTVQAAIASRLDALPRSEKRAIQFAAVLGDRFRGEALAELAGADPRAELEALERGALIEDRTADEADLYGFRHQLIREVAYASVTRAERVDLHVRAAAGVAARAGERYAELAEVIAFHLARAAELDPDPERTKAAFDAATQASGYAARRGAAARAQELLEQAARFAPDSAQRTDSLKAASELALRRLRGDDAFRLLIEAAESAEEAGEPTDAAQSYANAVEVASRMAGISGRFDEDHLHELLARAERLAPDPSPELQIRINLDRVWISWSNGRYDEEMTVPAAEALKLARQSGDVLLLSSALDAASSTSWVEGRYGEAASLNRERIDLLATQPRTRLVQVERGDAINMLSKALLRSGRVRDALSWDERNARETLATAPHIAAARMIEPMYLLGEWDRAIEGGVAMRESWYAEGRPPFAPFAPDFAAVAAIHGLRGDDAAHRDWYTLASEVAGPSYQGPGVRMLGAEVALHLGDLDRAVELIDDRAPGFWWRDPVLARRAEVFAVAGRDDAREAIELASERTTDDRFAAALRLRAEAILDGDHGPLRKALAIFDEIGCMFESARTRWLLGGAERDRAAETFAKLGALAPI